MVVVVLCCPVCYGYNIHKSDEDSKFTCDDCEEEFSLEEIQFKAVKGKILKELE